MWDNLKNKLFIPLLLFALSFQCGICQDAQREPYFYNSNNSLTGVKKEEVKLEVEKSGEIKISGEKLIANDNKYLYFEKTYKAPENSDLEKVTGKFEGEILYVNVPKQLQVPKLVEKKILQLSPPINKIEEDHHNIIKGNMEEKKMTAGGEVINQNEENIQEGKNKKLSNGNNGEGDGVKRRGKNSNSMLEGAIFMVTTNGHILLTAALAFSLGVLLSRKF